MSTFLRALALVTVGTALAGVVLTSSWLTSTFLLTFLLALPPLQLG
ncbi:hypothetical protein [Pelistega europaea]|uniref:Uncharacterized protein n=1 Tax=Pelistega europaea TaxID=106147 RepID=A0A7Y4P4C6_9BURK|nr:hypothetical protein [Pelistega europaea]NOL49947.1 hypothetical protein [Pelistega europaea]